MKEMAIKAPFRRCAAEASPKKTDSLSHMSARALTSGTDKSGQEFLAIVYVPDWFPHLTFGRNV